VKVGEMPGKMSDSGWAGAEIFNLTGVVMGFKGASDAT